jgi:hypothetical protein
VSVDAACRLAAFPDRPHDQRLATPHIAAREDARHARLIVGADGDVAALVETDAEVLEESLALGAEKAERQQNQLAVDLEQSRMTPSSCELELRMIIGQ